MQHGAWPAALNWDPAAVTKHGELQVILSRMGSLPTMLLVAGPDAREQGWAAEAAIALTERAAAARPCVLLDLSPEGGELHAPLGAESVEGVNDIFLYGASLKHVALRPANHRFVFAPAGLPGNPEAVLTHRRWQRLIGEVQGSGTQLFAYVPADIPGLEALARRIPRIIALALPEDIPGIMDRLGDLTECLAVLCPAEPEPGISRLGYAAPEPVEPMALAPSSNGPLIVPPSTNGPARHAPAEPGPAEPVKVEPAATRPEPPPAPPRPEPPPAPPERPREYRGQPEPVITRRSDEDFQSIRIPRDGARDAMIADLRAHQRAARMAPPPRVNHPALRPTAEPVAPEQLDGAPPETHTYRAEPRQPPLTEPGFASLIPRRRVKSRRTLIIALSLAGAALLAAGGWWSYQEYLRRRANPTLPETVRPSVSRSSDVPLPYSVSVEAHQELPLAIERVHALREEEPDISFYAAPFPVDTVVFYRVMAGPVADSAEATALLRRLLEKGHKTGAIQWDVRQSPLAFALGDFDSRSAAEEREQAVADLNIPAYVLPVQGLDGGRRYRVYAGAYSGIAEAEFLGRLLRAAGLPDSLVQRTGTRR